MPGGSSRSPDARLKALVRNFPENGMKLLLENPGNVKDLLLLTGEDLVRRINLDRIHLLPTSFVTGEYRNISSDVVLMAPLREGHESLSRRQNLMIAILIEHQSEPDPLMPLRMVDYVTQIFRFQERRWKERHGRSVVGFRLHPVLPVVFHTGTRSWETVGTLVDLVEGGDPFRWVTPVMHSLFVNLPAIQPETLEQKGGFFGWVLRLVQARRNHAGVFRRLLDRVVQRLESLSESNQVMWLDYLSYIQALVYHERNESEQTALLERIEASVRTDENRQEVSRMGRTIAEKLKDEGREEGSIDTARSTLLRQLYRRFGEVPRETVECIEGTSDFELLNAWLDRIVTAEALDDMGIGPRTR